MDALGEASAWNARADDTLALLTSPCGTFCEALHAGAVVVMHKAIVSHHQPRNHYSVVFMRYSGEETCYFASQS